ncbi:hypothetical protein ISN45_At03g010870 [Arabidopsis thaliana x Arabidopsis arenosa]|uniref:Transmembrane protein n=2 Tax=Arabidopsis TaxID=3701 RepID=A0A178VFE2_ARATH|nr:hypothetical protein ISN45_At03g010870 [Arabidopsis thaliana x Arabidopsis arenosa]OAP04494.1 hypothetical protein AXX17_AT3G10960 [Arabidopsis thaliana]CAA0382022.1 unnamed protein product [Arabidopsis thaliana]
MRYLMEKMKSKRDVIVCRGLWYAMTLLSIFGLSISLNLLLPSGDSSSMSRFLRDGAVSATTFYAVTILRYLFFTDPPSTCYTEFTTPKKRIPQVVFSELALYLVFITPLVCSLVFTKNVLSLLYISLFTISLFTGGIGLIQLTEKCRMETRHALITLFFGWLFGLFGIFEALYSKDYNVVALFVTSLYVLFSFGLFAYNFPSEKEKDLHTLTASPETLV